MRCVALHSGWPVPWAHINALQIVDTVLAKLFALGEKTTDLYALLDESDMIVFPEVEPVFRATGQYSALCKMYSKRGDDAALLEAWSKYVPLSFHVQLLTTLVTSSIADL